ncbi:5-formyltetrahydrofolate cyclo-ligase [Weissella confusa]|uniref:5-formyltetrahydrofolate cyclo-ligase n=1 Tax=Weissella confusa TaxID=1583 RepID=UPI001FD87530|nr:5-formyltetrahydrofolate cyclo-ligase [Weissella confusa]MDA5457914.1 5-formyltetrahydrofolate cyclo-ligase [Weissella confusa]MED4272152.1 5-formyltetrahydrofolate cyclo-ligase [Weissella confusa]MEE0002142.1 5-formyltetrahydrofolate cyclo-ligase [Weissella confusa]
MMDKNEAREIAKSNLAKLSDMQRATLMQQITSTVTALPAWQEASSVALTLSQDVELPTQLLIQTALLQGKKVYLPKVAPQRQLEFIQIDESTKYERHRFGMLEPIGEPLGDVTTLDFILVPGLAFSAAGDRLGFGGGYYDRWLPKTTGAKIAVTIPDNYVTTPNWEIEKTDQQVDKVIVLPPV